MSVRNILSCWIICAFFLAYVPTPVAVASGTFQTTGPGDTGELSPSVVFPQNSFFKVLTADSGRFTGGTTGGDPTRGTDDVTSAVTTSVASPDVFFVQPVTSTSALLSEIPLLPPARDNRGTDFWLTFPQNYVGGSSLSLLIAAAQSTSGLVMIPGMNFSSSFQVSTGQITRVVLPSSAQISTSDVVENKGIHVTSQHEVTVYGLNQRQATTDAYLALPTDILDQEYVNLTYPISTFGGNFLAGSLFTIVAAQNSTSVTITPSISVGGRPGGVDYTINLNSGQTYQLSAESPMGGDLSGSIVQANKPIAVFGGHKCTVVPSGYGYCDHIVEQLFPTSAWGSNYVTVPLATRTRGDTFRIVASNNNTIVSINGTQVVTLNRGQVHEQILTQASQITSNRPILVAQYSNSSDFDHVTSDPFMMLIPPVEQFVTSYTVATPASGISRNYINIVAPNASVGTIALDGTPIPSSAYLPIGDSGFSGAKVQVSIGTHNVVGNLPFGISVYGFDSYDSYGYPGGLSLAQVATGESFLSTDRTEVPADGTSFANLMLLLRDNNGNGLPGHRVRLLSTRSAMDVISPVSGTTDAGGRFVATIRSSIPGSSVVTAQDLTIGATLPRSVQITFTPVNGTPPAPPPNQGAIVITDINAQYPLNGRYLQGIALPNRINVTVDWRGTTPGRVDFVVNGTTHSHPAGGPNVSYTIDMNSSLRPGPNTLRIVAYNTTAGNSAAQMYAPYLVPAPAWLAGLQAVGAVAPMFMGGSVGAGYEYSSAAKIPPGGISLGAPSFGPPGSSTDLGFFVGGEVGLPLVCNSPVKIAGIAGAEVNIDLLGVELGGELKGSGSLEGRAIQCEIPSLSGNLRVDIKVYGQKNWPVLVFVINFIAPGAGDILQTIIPYKVLTILGEVYLQGNLRGSFASGVQTVLEAPYLEWYGVSLGGGPGVETGYQFKKLGVELKVFLGAFGTFEFVNPNPLQNWANLQFDNFAVRGEAGYTVKVIAWERGESFYVEWRYPPGRKMSTASISNEPSAWRLIGHPLSKNYASFAGKHATPVAFELSNVLREFELAPGSTITSVLVSNVYTYTEPTLAVDPVNDNAIMLWVHDDISKPVGQSHEINFSRWNGTTWSIPTGVTDDFKLDSAPQVAWTNTDQAVAVWQRLDDTLPITATWDITTANKIEIATASYDATTNNWSPVTLLTTNASLDMTPILARNTSGDLLAAWRQNDGGLLSGDETHPDRIIATFHSGSWGAPATAVDNIHGLVDLAAGYGNNAATIAYTRFLTPTGSITPTLQLFTSTWDGAAWSAPTQLTDDSLGNTDPQIVYNGSNQPLLVWLAGTQLQLRNLTTGSVVSLALPAEIGSIDEFRIVRDTTGNIAAVFTAQASTRDLYVALYDQDHTLWGLPVALTNDKNSEGYPAPALDSTGRLLMGYAQTEIIPVTHTTTITSTGQVVTYTVPTEGQTDLVTLSHIFVRNLSMVEGDVAVSDEHPAPGHSVTISATLRNTGDLALDNVAVAFYDGVPGGGGTLISTVPLPQPLAAGYTATLTTAYTVPATGGARTLHAVADPSNVIAEVDETDNTAALRAFGPDLAVADVGVDYWGGSQVGLVALVRNIGTTASPAAPIAYYRETLTGTLAIADTLPALAAGQTYTLTTAWDYGSLAQGTHVLAVTVNKDEVTFPEVFTENNTGAVTLEVLPDLAVSPLYVWLTSTITSTVEITAAVYNFGSVPATDAEIAFYYGDPLDPSNLVFTRTLASLAPASVSYVTGRWVSPSPGPVDLYVWADPTQTMTETTRVNNLASASIVLRPTSTFADPDNSRQCNNHLPCYTSLQTAIDNVATGGTVVYYPGDYNESISLSRDVTLTFAGGGDVGFVGLSISAGTFNAPGSNLTLAGNFTHSGGTFSHNNGTVTLVGSTAQTMSGATTFHNLTIANPAGCSSSPGLAVQGLLLIQQGAFTTASDFHSIQIDGGASLLANNDLTVSGDFQNSGSFESNGHAVILDGDSGQTLGGANPTTFHHLTVNNSSADGITLGQDQVVNGVLTFADGLLKVGSYTLTLGINATTTDGSAGSMVVTDTDGVEVGDGRLCKNYDAIGPFTFPVGDAFGDADYSPATVSFSQGTFPGEVCVSVTDSRNPYTPGSADNYLTRYWTATSTVGTPTYDAVFTFASSDVVGSTSEMSGKKWDGTGLWQTLEVVSGSSFSGIDLHSFSVFTAFDTPLAVTLAGFRAIAADDKVHVIWETVSEIDNVGFNIYRGSFADGSDRAQLAFVPAQTPGSTQGASYRYDDTSVEIGQTYWYWLEDVDLSGVTTLHGPVSATVSAPTAVTLSGLDTSENSPAPIPAPVPLAALPAAAGLALGVAAWLRRKR